MKLPVQLPPLDKRAAVVACAAAAVLLAAIVGFRWDRDFRKAKSFERSGRAEQAAAQFQVFVARHPKDKRVAEALVRASLAYARLGRCELARPLLERAARDWFDPSDGVAFKDQEPPEPAEPPRPLGPEQAGFWGRRARLALLSCPDYFPLQHHKDWIYVDSQSGGKNMRLELNVSATADGSRGKATGSYFAGKTKFKSYERRYEKAYWSVWEIQGRDRVRILRYPFTRGLAWTSKREGQPVEFKIESDKAVVKVKAGKFENCLKVRESQPGSAAWKYDYYAPGVGRVKTTIGSQGLESPNTELKSYSGLP